VVRRTRRGGRNGWASQSAQPEETSPLKRYLPPWRSDRSFSLLLAGNLAVFRTPASRLHVSLLRPSFGVPEGFPRGSVVLLWATRKMRYWGMEVCLLGNPSHVALACTPSGGSGRNWDGRSLGRRRVTRVVKPPLSTVCWASNLQYVVHRVATQRYRGGHLGYMLNSGTRRKEV
jgi:hypothetical protein